jgi:Acetyltransferase (GNAT) domain
MNSAMELQSSEVLNADEQHLAQAEKAGLRRNLGDETNSNGGPGTLRYLRRDEWATVWNSLVDISPQGSPFVRSWWLEAVGGTVEILGYFKGGSLVAGMPLYSEKRFGIPLYTMPKLTQTLGPVLAAPTGKQVAAIWQEMEVLGAFAKELARFRIFFQAFHPSLHNWSPFFWNGFTQTSRATQVVDLSAPDKLSERMAKGARRHIRKAERQGITIEPCSPENLWRAEEQSFSRQRMKVPHSIEYLKGLHDAAQNNHAGGCFAAFDRERRMHCACFIVWDNNRAYTVASGADPELRDSGAHSLLTLYLARLAAEHSPVLDFAGSMLQTVELFLRSFGAVQVPYNWIMKFPMPIKLYLTLRDKI